MATAGAQYVLPRLRACRPEWSIHDVVTTEPHARPTLSFFTDVESVAAFAAECCRREA